VDVVFVVLVSLLVQITSALLVILGNTLSQEGRVSIVRPVIFPQMPDNHPALSVAPGLTLSRAR